MKTKEYCADGVSYRWRFTSADSDADRYIHKIPPAVLDIGRYIRRQSSFQYHGGYFGMRWVVATHLQV